MASKVLLGGELMFPSEYLSAVEFKGRDVTLTIDSVKIKQLQMKGGKTEDKPVIAFKETKKSLVCNKTNADSIAEMYGTEATAWIGKRVTFYPTKTQCGRATVDCIRVREKVPGGAAKPAAELPPTDKDDILAGASHNQPGVE